MKLSQLTAISPIDGRYGAKLEHLRAYASEFALMRYRTRVEIEWLIMLCEHPKIDARPLNNNEIIALRDIYQNFTLDHAQIIKQFEKQCQHDLKSVEYFIADQCRKKALSELVPWIHFCCTSEDINNVAYALMLKDLQENSLIPSLDALLVQLEAMAQQYAGMPMLSRTHGQPATPTTLGKELSNMAMRLHQQLSAFKHTPHRAKFNGATGNYNAHLTAYPHIAWKDVSQAFIESFQLSFNTHSTQIEPHDDLAAFMHHLMRINTILIDVSRDIWTYISLNYFKQANLAQEVGSSTMPHKINPIQFENAEGNLGVCNTLAHHLASKLPISRMQRDLSDSTVLRNIGSIVAYANLSYSSLLSGLEKLEANEAVLKSDLNHHWELLAEPIQTVMRCYGIENAYEQLKAFSRGQIMNEVDIRAFIEQLNIPESAKATLEQLTPENYLGLAKELCLKII